MQSAFAEFNQDQSIPLLSQANLGMDVDDDASWDNWYPAGGHKMLKNERPAPARLTLSAEDLDFRRAVEPRIQLFSPREFERIAAMCASDEERMRVKSLLQALEGHDYGNERLLKRISKTWRTELDAIERQFPHCVEVIDFLRINAALVEHGTGVLELSILLDGPPGCGKTMLSEVISEWLGAGRESIQCASAQSGACLAGVDSFFTAAKPGAVFNSLIFAKKYANPCFLLDELDKITTEGRYDPTGPMLGLLERPSAARFKDLCAGFEIAANHINWIATSNEKSKISLPILSRLTPFEIPMPTQEQALSICKVIADGVVNEHPATKGIGFSTGALEQLSKLSPRAQKAEIKMALGRVLFRQGDAVSERDIKAVEAPRARIGFLPG